MAEVRTMREGTLWFVYASGSGSAWATASAPTSGLLAFVESMTFRSAQTVTTIMERGTPHHHKVTEVAPIEITVRAKWTGAFPTAISGSGASVPMFHLEYKAVQPELGNTGRYYQFHGCVSQGPSFNEQAQGDTIEHSFRALAMNGETASGFLS